MEVDCDENTPGDTHCTLKNVASEDVASVVAINDTSDGQTNPCVVPSSSGYISEINMEISITPDDVTLAGGLGATDDITRILSAASDSTDYEGRLIEIRDCEDSEDNDAVAHPNPERPGEVYNLDAENAQRSENKSAKDEYEAVHMEEMIRAGGFGATDDINNFLPVASDFTDFEAHLRDAEDYEDRVKEINRYGLGWIRGSE